MAIPHYMLITSAPFIISAIYFGFRCDVSIITSIIKLLAGNPVKFYKKFTLNNSFQLKRLIECRDEVEACGLKSPVFLDLRQLPNIDESDT